MTTSLFLFFCFPAASLVCSKHFPALTNRVSKYHILLIFTPVVIRECCGDLCFLQYPIVSCFHCSSVTLSINICIESSTDYSNLSAETRFHLPSSQHCCSSREILLPTNFCNISTQQNLSVQCSQRLRLSRRPSILLPLVGLPFILPVAARQKIILGWA